MATFLLFLLLASILWLLHSTSSQREMRSSAIIKYAGIPHEIIFDHQLPDKIEFMVKDDDKQLWSYLTFSTDTLYVDLTNHFTTDATLEIEYEQYLHKMITQFSPTAKITDLSPSMFSTGYTRLATKTVGIRLAKDINISQQHMLTDSISIIPSQITIIGRQETINPIESLLTTEINETVTSSKSIRCNIVFPEGVTSETKTVSVVIPIEASTEKRLTLPINTINVPEGQYLRLFPNEVDAVFNVGLSRYSKVTPSDFNITVDYNDIAPNATTLPIKIATSPSDIKKLRISPQNSEYIIEK